MELFKPYYGAVLMDVCCAGFVCLHPFKVFLFKLMPVCGFCSPAKPLGRNLFKHLKQLLFGFAPVGVQRVPDPFTLVRQVGVPDFAYFFEFGHWLCDAPTELCHYFTYPWWTT